MKLIFSIIFLGFTISAFSPESFKGQFTLWKRPLCLETGPGLNAQDCPFPQPIGPKWITELSLSKPTQPGTSKSSKQTLRQVPWTVQLSMYWVLPASLVERDYFITQARVTHDTYGFLFECSSYDYLENIKNRFPTGACSGRIDKDQIGMAMQKAL